MTKEKDIITITFCNIETGDIGTTLAKSHMTLEELLFIYNNKYKHKIAKLYNKYYQEIPLSYRIQGNLKLFYVE